AHGLYWRTDHALPLSPRAVSAPPLSTGRRSRPFESQIESAVAPRAPSQIETVMPIRPRACVPLFVTLLLLGAAPLRAAEEPSGCDKFKWDITRARAALTAPDRAKLASGSEQAA